MLILTTIIIRSSFTKSNDIAFTKDDFLFNLAPSFLCQGENIKDIPDPIIVQENSFLAVSSPQKMNLKTIGVLTGQEIFQEPENKIIHYIVEEGETLLSVAKDFGVSLETILWANDLNVKSKLKAGQELIILPVSGVMHLVKKDETVSKIAEDYRVKTEEVLSFNGINQDEKIFAGDILIIPGGKIFPKPTTLKPQLIPIPNSYFICPVSRCNITQGLHWYNAIDFSTGECGSPVFAAAQGLIQKTGYQNVAGNYIRILHPNNVVTFYGHLSKIIVKQNQQVSQGEIIGYIGHSGYTIPKGEGGCHLHFDVRGGINPFAR